MAAIAENPGYKPTPPDEPLVAGTNDFHTVTEAVIGISERKPHPAWILGWLVSLFFLAVLGASIAWLVWEGTGIWGVTNPTGWGWAIVNFVWWIGIGHAGTLISAILFLFRQKWRTSINRFAEAMTIFAVACAGIFPVIHVGRVWVAYFMFPLPNQMSVWPQFRSPLLWDVFAVSTYATTSILFWYLGMVPDLASTRDRAKHPLRKFGYSIVSLGWRASHRHWRNYEAAYGLLAGLATPLVLSVHTIVSFDFAVSNVPGWHTTIFPPYFVAGAIFSGFAMVMSLILPARAWFGLKDFVTMRHLDNMCKIMLVTGSMVGYAYSIEFFIAWYSGNVYEKIAFINRAFGPYAWAYWSMVTCNVIVPQLFWFRRMRRNIPWMFIASFLINIGMWFERFVITVTSLANDFMPSSWTYYRPTIFDVSTYLGSFGLFFTLFLLFLKLLPVLAISEIKGVMPQADPHAGGHGHDPGHHAGKAHA